MPLSVVTGNIVDEEVMRDLAVEEETHKLDMNGEKVEN
jgi:hypothetical protein